MSHAKQMDLVLAVNQLASPTGLEIALAAEVSRLREEIAALQKYLAESDAAWELVENLSRECSETVSAIRASNDRLHGALGELLVAWDGGAHTDKMLSAIEKCRACLDEMDN